MLRMVGVYQTLGLTIRPSEFVGIDEDEYTRFCFDEAFAFILAQLRAGEEPNICPESEKPAKTYSSFSQLYKKYEKK